MPSEDNEATRKKYGLKSDDYDLLVLGSCAIGLSILYNLLQESLFTSDAKKYTALITMMTSLVYAALALVEFQQHIGGKKSPKALIGSMKGTMIDYAQLGTLTAAGMYFTNWSLQYLNYTLRVLFKASKIIPTIMIAVLYYKKSFSMKEYLNIGVLVISIVLFSYGDAVGKGKTDNSTFDVFGIALITAGVIADALTSNFEAEHLFKTRGASHSEVMMAASLFGSMYMFLIMIASGEAQDAFTYAFNTPSIVAKVVISCSAGYFSITFILKIIQKLGAVTAEIVKSVRRVVSIVLSFMIYHKPFLSWHLAGSVAFLLFIYQSFMAKKAKAAAKQELKKLANGDIELELSDKTSN